MPIQLPIGVSAAVNKTQDEAELDRLRQKQRDIDNEKFYRDLNARLDKTLAPLPPGGWRVPKPGVPLPVEINPEPQMRQQVNPADGVGGPEGPTPAWASAPVIEDTPAAPAPMWMQAPVIEAGPSQPLDLGQPAPKGPDINEAINEAVGQIPGGYKAYLEKTQPPPAGYRYEMGNSGDPFANPKDANTAYMVGPDGMRWTAEHWSRIRNKVGNLQKTADKSIADTKAWRASRPDFVNAVSDTLVGAPVTSRDQLVEQGIRGDYAPGNAERNSISIPIPFLPYGAGGTIPLGRKEDPWNVQAAEMLDKGVGGVAEAVQGQTRNQQNDLTSVLANAFVKPMADTPAAVLRDPNQAVQDLDPFHQIGRAYNNTNYAIGDALQGDWQGAAGYGSEALTEGSAGVMGIMGLRAVPRGAPGSFAASQSGQARVAPLRPPSIRRAGQSLAAVAVPGQPIRPQALRAIERILVSSGIPKDRIARGIDNIQQAIPSHTGRPLTVAQFFQREFSDEFPQVTANIDTVLRERGLVTKPGDASPTIVQTAAQEMRTSQVPFLEESAVQNLGGGPVAPEIARIRRSQVPRITTAANRNFGPAARTGTRQQIEENLRQMGREGYEPILQQPIEGWRQDDILYTLHGPQMGELMRPLRQIAAGEGLNIDQFIAEQPLRAAHWMQHKARLLVEANADNVPMAMAYNGMRNRILLSLDDLVAPDGRTYAQLRNDFGDEAQINQALNAGDRFGGAVRNPEGADNFINSLQEMTPQQRAGAFASVRDWVFSRVRGGAEDAPARIDELTQRGVLDTFDRMGPEGAAFANELRAIRNENRGLQTIENAGTSFSQLATSPENLMQTLQTFRGLPPQQQALFLGNLRDWVQGRLRGGAEDAPARIQYLSQMGVLDALDQLGPGAAALADDIRAIRAESRFLSRVTNTNVNGGAQSATIPNSTALNEGPNLYSRGGPSTAIASAMADGALMMTGMSQAPFLTALREGPKLYSGIMRPRTATREDMTRLLMARPEGFGPIGNAPRGGGPTRTGGGGDVVPRFPVTPEEQAGLMQEYARTEPLPEAPVNRMPVATAGAMPPRAPASAPDPVQRPRLAPRREPEWTGPKPQQPQSLMAWVRSKGGIMDRNFMTGDTKQALGGRAQAYPGLINNKSGQGLDDLVAAAAHEGFDVDPNDAGSLMRLIEDEIAGSPSYRIGQKEEWEVYQDFLRAKDRGTTLETPPELAGMGVGGLTGMVAPADFNRDGETTPEERATAMAIGVGGGFAAGRYARGANLNPARSNAFFPLDGVRLQPWQKEMRKAAFDDQEIELVTRYMRDQFGGKSPQQIADRMGVPMDSLAGRITDLQQRLTEAGIPVDIRGGSIAPNLKSATVKPADRAPKISADQISAKDLILGYNDGDLAMHVGVDLDLPDDVNIRRVVTNRQRKLREQVKVAQANGGLDRLAQEIGVTPDELERFAVIRPHPLKGGYQQSIERIVDVMEKAEKLGNPMRPVDAAKRLGLAPGSVKAMLSQARRGVKPLPGDLKARVQALKIVKGRPIELAAQSPPEVGGMLVGGGAGFMAPVDANRDGVVDDNERVLSMAIGAGGGLVAGRVSRGRRVDPTKSGSFGGSLAKRAEEKQVPNFIEDATDENMQKVQLDMIGRGEVPFVFKTFRMPDGRVIAWNGDEARGGIGHLEARELLGLGNMRLEHSQSWLGGPPLAKSNWYDVTGEGPAPRSIEKMMRDGMAQGRDPLDILGDAYPDEAVRDLRNIGAVGPGNRMKDYSHRRKLAMDRVESNGVAKLPIWDTPNGTDAWISFGAGDEPSVNFYIGGRQTRDGGKLQNATGQFVRDLTPAETKQTFEKAFAVLEREAIKRGKDAYHFQGASDAHHRLYAGTLQRLGAPQGYVALLDEKRGFFSLFRVARYNELVRERRIDPADWTVIPSKRGDKAVPDWRRATGQFALPIGAAGLAFAGSQNTKRADEPRPQ